MSCTNTPLQNVPCSRESLISRCGFGEMWDFLKDMLSNLVGKADLVDSEGRYFFGLDNRMWVTGEVEDYEEYLGFPEAVADIFQENPQADEMLQDPGMTMFIRTSNQYRLPTPGSGWLTENTIKELEFKVTLNGETYYGYIPLYSEKDNDAVAVPDSMELLSITPLNFTQVGTALEQIRGSWVDLCDKLGRQGVMRMIYKNWGSPG